MKFNAVLALLPLALAAPAQLQKRLPNHTPVDVAGLDADFTVNCGQYCYDRSCDKEDLTYSKAKPKWTVQTSTKLYPGALISK
jgi:hypothetical protein